MKGLYKGHLPPRVGLLQETKARKNMRNNERNTDNEKLVKYPNKETNKQITATDRRLSESTSIKGSL